MKAKDTIIVGGSNDGECSSNCNQSSDLGHSSHSLLPIVVQLYGVDVRCQRERKTLEQS